MNNNTIHRILINNRALAIVRTSFLIGFLFINIRLESAFNSTDDYCYYPDLVSSDLVISEQGSKGLSLVPDDDLKDTASRYVESVIPTSHNASLEYYGSLIHVKFKAIISVCRINSRIISILQKNNTSHKSSKEERAIIL